MSVFNLTVEDSSPLITYAPAGAWSDSPSSDPLLSNYSASCFHTTSTAGATATFTWNGTGIWVYGALRQDHGHFQANLDGGPVSTFNGFAQNATMKFNLVHASGFAMGLHTLVLTNSPESGDQATGFDVDFIVVQTELPPSTSPTTVTLDDAAPELSYLPSSSAWTTNDQAFFFNKTSHVTQTPGALMSFEFTGESVAVHGSMSQNHAPYTVSVDGHKTLYTPSVSSVHASTMLFLGSNFGPGVHQLTITNDAQGTGDYLDVDYLQVFSSGAAPTNGSSPGTGATANLSSAGKHASSIGTAEIAAIIAGVLFLLCALAAAFVLVFKLRRKRRSNFDTRKPQPIMTVATVPVPEKSDYAKPVPQRPATRPPTLGDFAPARPGRTGSLILSPTAGPLPSYQIR
jgi:hypothetical protein